MKAKLERIARIKVAALKPWQEKAKKELEAELGVETEVMGGTNGDSFSLESTSGSGSNGESEWEIFQKESDAYDYAVERTIDSLEGGLKFGELLQMAGGWAQDYLTVSSTDIRIISNEDGDNYASDIRYESDDRLIEEAGMERAYEKLQEKLEREEDSKKIKRIEKDIEKLLDKAEEKVSEDVADRTKDRLENDLVDYLDELGYLQGLRDIEKVKWLKFDWEGAAKYAVDTDGIAHAIDSYDGEELDLPSGATAYGTN